MKKLRIVFVSLLLLILLVVPIYTLSNVNAATTFYSTTILTEKQVEKIEEWVQKCMNTGKIPGASVAVVSGEDTVYINSFGYSNIENEKLVTEDTLFEIGSTSKAFTGLAVLQLVSEGKMDLEQTVSYYLPWFEMKYKGIYKEEELDEVVDITLYQLLHHTSGIPTESIGYIPEGGGEDALEETVKGLVGNYLDTFPGEAFQYATINYDILGLIIQDISNMSFEDYTTVNILENLDLNNTYLKREKSSQYDLSTGYKLGFLKAKEYEAPMYRGNTPAGYVIMNIQDVAKWLMIQLGASIPETFDTSIIELSHIADKSVTPINDGSSYAVGWKVYQSGDGVYAHGGSNPNYSSHFIFNVGDQIGVGVLANLDSTYTDYMAQGIMDIIEKDSLPALEKDEYKVMDIAATIVLATFSVLGITVFVCIVLVIVDLLKGKRKFIRITFENIIVTVMFIAFMLFMGYCLYCLPEVVYSDVPWDFVVVWSPFSLIPAIITFYITSLLFGIYYLLVNHCSKENEKPLFPIVVLSFVSGFANALIIFSINNAVNRIRDLNKGVVLLFVFGLVLYIVGQKVIKSKLIQITNEVIYEKRTTLIESVLRTSLDKFELLGNDKVYACLNNDTEAISNTPGVIIGIFTDSITLLFCFVYLGAINIFGLLLSILVLIIAAVFYYLVGRSANGLLERARKTQNAFFGFISDLVNGFKELRINSYKSVQFKDDMFASCNDYKENCSASSIKFINVEIIGDMLFTIVIATVAFIFPYLFKDIQESALNTYILVFLYISTPINGILKAIPFMFSIRISWKRIKEFMKSVPVMADENEHKILPNVKNGDIHLKLEDVVYEYKSGDRRFRLGEINLEFNSGQIIFVTGGNGSGKSTLAKVLTGLYAHQYGKIYLNGKVVQNYAISDLYSQVFADFHLFKKIYGVDYEDKQDKIDELLKMLQLDNKVNIEEGKFSTIDLSTGQKKRLALLVSYLEDKQIFLFDEWAADQDPEFRRYFYESIISDLRDKGKCVVVISHDDRYFNMADILIKMEFGKIQSILKKTNIDK